MIRAHLALMLKAPVPGRVKTRLAAALGPEAACQAYRLMTEHLLRRLPPGWPATVWFDPPGERPRMEGWLGPKGMADFRPQPGGDLGARMLAALDPAERAAATTGTLVIPGDCPGIDADLLRAAAAALAEVDLVLGPAADGGYYLVGQARPVPALFHDMQWSVPTVRAVTLERAERLGLRVHLLARLDDVDEAADWEQACRDFPDLAAAPTAAQRPPGD